MLSTSTKSYIWDTVPGNAWVIWMQSFLKCFEAKHFCLARLFSTAIRRALYNLFSKIHNSVGKENSSSGKKNLSDQTGMMGRRETAFYFISRIHLKAFSSWQTVCKASISAPASLQQLYGRASKAQGRPWTGIHVWIWHLIHHTSTSKDRRKSKEPVSTVVLQTPKSLQSYLSTPRQLSVGGEALCTPLLDQRVPSAPSLLIPQEPDSLLRLKPR